MAALRESAEQEEVVGRPPGEWRAHGAAGKRDDELKVQLGAKGGNPVTRRRLMYYICGREGLTIVLMQEG